MRFIQQIPHISIVEVPLRPIFQKINKKMEAFMTTSKSKKIYDINYQIPHVKLVTAGCLLAWKSLKTGKMPGFFFVAWKTGKMSGIFWKSVNCLEILNF